MRHTAIEMVDQNLPGASRITLGADKAYDTADFIATCRALNITPHVAANDGRRLAELRHTLFGAPAPGTTPLEGRVTFAELRAAMPFDAIAFRAFWRVMGMLAKPDDVYTDPDVVTHTQDVLRSLDTAPVMTRPTHAELEAALA